MHAPANNYLNLNSGDAAATQQIAAQAAVRPTRTSRLGSLSDGPELLIMPFPRSAPAAADSGNGGYNCLSFLVGCCDALLSLRGVLTELSEVLGGVFAHIRAVFRDP